MWGGVGSWQPRRRCSFRRDDCGACGIERASAGQLGGVVALAKGVAVARAEEHRRALLLLTCIDIGSAWAGG